MSLYADPAARERIRHLYRRQVERLPQPVESCFVETPCGRTHLLLAGDPDARPLLAVPGLQTGGGFNLELLWPLTGAFRLISPDIPGQAGLSAEVPPDRDGGYGRWLLSMLDGLGIERCAMVGISFGGAVVLDAIRLAPLRVERASLIVPAGLEISLWRTLKATLRPWLSYRWHRDDPHFAALMKPLMAEPWPELCQFYQAVLSDLHPPVRVPPGPFSAAELRHFDGAVQLVLARHDLYFEPEALEAAAREALPKLSDILLLDDSHIPGRNSRRELHQRVLAFLADSGR